MGKKGSRRRRTYEAATDPPRKTGWQVRESIARAVKAAVGEGAAESQNAFVEQALVRELRELRRRRVYGEYAQAAQDPAFMKEMKATTSAFDTAAGDGLAPGEV